MDNNNNTKNGTKIFSTGLNAEQGMGGTGIVNLTSAVRVSSRIDNDKSMKSIDSNNHVSVAVEPRSKQKGKKKIKKRKI